MKVGTPAPPTAPETRASFRTFLQAAGKLAVARQVSGLVFVGAVLTLPALTSRATSTDFVWAYFAMLTLTSLLGLGLERLAGPVTAERGEQSLARSLAPVLAARVVTLPLVAPSLWALFAFVGVHVPGIAWAAIFVWIAAGLFGPLVFAALRVVGHSSAEPIIMVAVRAIQAATLVALAVAGAGLSAMLVPIAALEVLGVVIALRMVGRWREYCGGFAAVASLPVRRGGSLAGIELVVLLNLRVDLLLIGRILGATTGAVYGLVYRVVDSFSGLVGSAGIWLYAESANGNDGGEDGAGIRARSLLLLPRIGVGLGLVVIVLAGPVATFIQPLHQGLDTLRVLVIAFPLLTVSTIELHVRSGRGRNREVLAINCAALCTNVGFCLALLPTIGMVGGAIALAASECVQAVLLLVSASAEERALVAPAFATAGLGAVLLAVTGVALTQHWTPLAVLGAILTAVIVLVQMPWARARVEALV